MKLLKMVYIGHGWFLGLNGKPLISEAVEAWKYGPVIDKVYQGFKKYGKDYITSLIDLNQNGKVDEREFLPNPEVQDFLTKIWDYNKKYDGLQLSSLTHQEGSPWHNVVKYHGINSIIPNIEIQEHYAMKASTAA